jgi:signal recognition particle receptor subunit beta
MVQINMSEREITVKVVFYGPALSGKTTNLQMLHQLVDSGSRGKMLTLDTTGDRTLYFDFLPIEFGTSNGFSVKLKLRSSASANAYSWRDMEANLKSNGIDFEAIPKVVQFNKRDLEDVKPLDEIKEAWGGIPTFPAVATRGEGVRETFRELLRQLYRTIDERHGFGAKFGVSEEDFLKGVFSSFG